MTEKPIKCAANGFVKNPFYLIQSNGEEKRFVASFQDKKGIQHFLNEFIGQSEKIQIKIRDFDDPENPIDYNGQASQLKVKEILDKYEFIFHNGFHVLMLRIPENGDYIAFDEHGLIFIYADKDYSMILKNYGLSHDENAKLIYEVDHWHYSKTTDKEDLKILIDEIGLEV